MSQDEFPYEDPAILRMQRERISKMSPEERLGVVRDLMRFADTMAEAGIRDRFPEASDREVFLRLAVRKLGYGVARTVYPEIESLDGIRH